MAKNTWTAAIATLALCVGLVGCGTSAPVPEPQTNDTSHNATSAKASTDGRGDLATAHAITVVDENNLMDWCPESAVEGETVRFRTFFVTDVVMVVDAGDVELVNVGRNTYEFVMPDHEVTIRVSIKTAELGGA